MFQILKENGHNIVRIRLYNNPGPGRGNGEYYCPEGIMDKEDVLKLSKRAKEAGMQIQFTFHYSDYWSNGGTQIIPYEWQEQIKDLKTEEEIVDKLAGLVYEYTKEIMQALKDQGPYLNMYLWVTKCRVDCCTRMEELQAQPGRILQDF